LPLIALMNADLYAAFAGRDGLEYVLRLGRRFSDHPMTRSPDGPIPPSMDQQQADRKHHRAGYAMNRERSGLSTARPKNVGHVAKRDDGEN
jgi:hypothetical protein